MSDAEVLLIPISVRRRNKEYVAVFFFFTTCMAAYIVLDSVDLSYEYEKSNIREEELNSGLLLLNPRIARIPLCVLWHVTFFIDKYS